VGRDIIQKNALVALAQYRNDPTRADAARALLEVAKLDTRPAIHAVAEWISRYMIEIS